MEKITSVSGLKEAIKILEEEQDMKGQQLKDQLRATYESFKPAKLLGSTLKEMIASPYLMDNILDTTIGLASGYLSRRIVVGASGSVIRKLLGVVVQSGVTSFVSKHSGGIKSVGQAIFHNIFRKKEAKSDKL